MAESSSEALLRRFGAEKREQQRMMMTIKQIRQSYQVDASLTTSVVYNYSHPQPLLFQLHPSWQHRHMLE